MPTVTKDNPSKTKHGARKRGATDNGARKRGADETTQATRRRRFARSDDARTAAEKKHHEVEDVVTDSLQLFFNEARKYPLLTAAEEIQLAQRIEKGDIEAKDRMINSNLRLVVSVARKYQGHGLTP